MVRQVLQIVSGFVLLLVLVRCAQVGELSGGKKDTTPPKLLEAIPANKSTGFNGDEIILKFNEYVQVKDLSSQLIVSPKLKTAPEINASGKSVVVSLKKEELAPNTTYRIYFGNAIADMNESNSIPDFEYVFSTGPAIDSLKLGGLVSDAFNNKPVGNVLVGLYYFNTATDSTPYKEAPDYYARTNAGGQFAFGNLPHATFKAVAFTDNNKNGIYDGESEKVAFRDSALRLVSDTSISLQLFQEESQKGFIKKTVLPYYGFGQILLNKKAKVRLEPLDEELKGAVYETRAGVEKDTVSFFYKGLKDTVMMAVNNLTFKKLDTVRLIIPKNNSAKRRLKPVATNLRSGILPLGSSLKLTFLTWMDTTRADLSKLKLSSREDSAIAAIPVTGRWTGVAEFELLTRLKEGVSYNLKLDTMAFFDSNGFTNDSLIARFKTQGRTEFGKVTLKLLLNKKQDYLVQLVTATDQVIRQQEVHFALSSSNAVSLVFTDVLPGTYNAKIVFDDNANKKWDSGNLLSRKQPERIIIHSKQLKVLSDWEIEEEIIVKE